MPETSKPEDQKPAVEDKTAEKKSAKKAPATKAKTQRPATEKSNPSGDENSGKSWICDREIHNGKDTFMPGDPFEGSDDEIEELRAINAIVEED